MRLSDLLGCTIVDAAGDRLGEVADVRLAQDGPLLAGITAALRVDALLIGQSSLAERLGYVHGGVSRPALLARALRALGRRVQLVEWADVEAWDPEAHEIRLRADAAIEQL